MRLFTSRPWKRLVVAAAMSTLLAGGCRQEGWPLWEGYKARFIDAQGRVSDPHDRRNSIAEGQPQALFFALLTNDRTEFDRVLTWTQTNLAGGDLGSHLCTWEQGNVADGTSYAKPVSGADVWLTYTLLEAGRLWGNAAYTAMGRGQLALIAKSEVADLPGFGPMLLPGPQGFQRDREWIVNPGYLPVFIFERFAHVDPAGPWQEIAWNIPRVLEGSARHGFAMDWVEYVPGDGFYPAAQDSGDVVGAQDAGGSYDAMRVYVWAAMIGAESMRQRTLNALPGMSGYLVMHNYPPERVDRNGIPAGSDGPVGFSAALLPYLRASGESKIAARQMMRMNSERNAATGLYGSDMAYGDQSLALFGIGFLDERFWFGEGGELNVAWKKA